MSCACGSSCPCDTAAPNARQPLRSDDARALAGALVRTTDTSALARQTAVLGRLFPEVPWGTLFTEAL